MSIHYSVKFSDGMHEVYASDIEVIEALKGETFATVFIINEDDLTVSKLDGRAFEDEYMQRDQEDPRAAYEDFRFHSDKHEAA